MATITAKVENGTIIMATNPLLQREKIGPGGLQHIECLIHAAIGCAGCNTADTLFQANRELTARPVFQYDPETGSGSCYTLGVVMHPEDMPCADMGSIEINT